MPYREKKGYVEKREVPIWVLVLTDGMGEGDNHKVEFLMNGNLL
jgi:hypothetical protein